VPRLVQGAIPDGVTVLGAGKRETPIGAYDVPVRNTIGSGDVFAGTIAAALATEMSF
jgi:sugar/nucleoside kinase (ribokinase family)